MTTEDYEPTEQLVKTMTEMLEQFLWGHVRDLESEGEDWSGPHPISVETDARRIAAAAAPHHQIAAYDEAADALGHLAGFHEGSLSADWIDGVNTAQKLIDEQADALRAELATEEGE